MRVLAIGYPLPDMAIDNYNPLTAPAYSDYDALIIDPASITPDSDPGTTRSTFQRFSSSTSASTSATYPRSRSKFSSLRLRVKKAGMVGELKIWAH